MFVRSRAHLSDRVRGIWMSHRRTTNASHQTSQLLLILLLLRCIRPGRSSDRVEDTKLAVTARHFGLVCRGFRPMSFPTGCFWACPTSVWVLYVVVRSGRRDAHTLTTFLDPATRAPLQRPHPDYRHRCQVPAGTLTCIRRRYFFTPLHRRLADDSVRIQ